MLNKPSIKVGLYPPPNPKLSKEIIGNVSRNILSIQILYKKYLSSVFLKLEIFRRQFFREVVRKNNDKAMELTKDFLQYYQELLEDQIIQQPLPNKDYESYISYFKGISMIFNLPEIYKKIVQEFPNFEKYTVYPKNYYLFKFEQFYEFLNWVNGILFKDFKRDDRILHLQHLSKRSTKKERITNPILNAEYYFIETYINLNYLMDDRIKSEENLNQTLDLALISSVEEVFKHYDEYHSRWSGSRHPIFFIDMANKAHNYCNKHQFILLTKLTKNILKTETGIVIVDQTMLSDKSSNSVDGDSIKFDWEAFSDDDPSKLESLFLGLNDNDKKLLRAFEFVALRTLKKNPQNFYDLFATLEAKDKTLSIVRNLDYIIDMQFKFNDFDVGTFESTVKFLQSKWISSTRDMNPTSSQDIELKSAAKELFTKEILPFLSQNMVNSKKQITRALMINTLVKFFDSYAPQFNDKRVTHELDNFNDILESLLIHSRHAKLVSEAEYFADLYPEAVLSNFFHLFSFTPRSPYFPRLIGSGVILELNSVLEFLGKQHLSNIREGLTFKYAVRELTRAMVNSIKDKFLGAYSTVGTPSKLNYFDALGLRVYHKSLDSKSVELFIESNEVKNSREAVGYLSYEVMNRFKPDFFAVLNQVPYHILGGYSSGMQYSMEHTTVRLNHLSPVMNNQFKTFNEFSKSMMSLYANGLTMNDLAWKDKVSVNDYNIKIDEMYYY